MAGLLEPRTVTVRDIPDWLRESGRLLMRRPLLFASLSLTYHFLALSTRSLSVLSLLVAVLLCQVSVSIVILFAEAVDHSRAVTPRTIYLLVHNILASLLLLTLLYALFYLAGAAVVLMLNLDLPVSDHSGSPAFGLLAWLIPGNTAFLILFMGISVSTLWFLIPLLSLHPLGLKGAVILARRAEGKNEWVVFLVSYVPCAAMVVAAMLSEWALAAGVVMVPLLGAFQYVAYRHVFLGRKVNAPVPVSAVAAVPASAMK